VCLTSAAIAELRASETLSEVVRVTNQAVGELLLTATKVETSPRLAFMAVVGLGSGLPPWFGSLHGLYVTIMVCGRPHTRH
jgi:hypothetical protein